MPPDSDGALVHRLKRNLSCLARSALGGPSAAPPRKGDCSHSTSYLSNPTRGNMIILGNAVNVVTADRKAMKAVEDITSQQLYHGG